MAEFRRLGERQVHQGYVWRVVVADFQSPDGEVFQRDLVRSPGAVSALPVLEGADGPEVVLVHQYRPPYETYLYEAPAGMRDVPGEPTVVTARRELIEEAGLDAGRLVPIGEIHPSPGLTDSVTTLYLAFDCTAVERQTHGPEEAHMSVVRLPLADAVAMALDGRITDAKTVISVLRAERMLRDG